MDKVEREDDVAMLSRAQRSASSLLVRRGSDRTMITNLNCLVGSQIRFLVTNLNRKNLKSSIAELHNVRSLSLSPFPVARIFSLALFHYRFPLFV